MPKLTATDFNSARFFGYDGNMLGGYGKYQPVWYIVNPAYNSDPLNEFWTGLGDRIATRFGLKGKKLLEMGCVMGSLVRALRRVGVDAYGLDLAWPINYGLTNLWPEMEPYLMVADARDWVKAPERKANEYEVILSRGFLECFTSTELNAMISRLNWIGKTQIHILSGQVEPEHYTSMDKTAWQVLCSKATIVDDL